MNISEAAELSGLSAKTIRYYEQIGLIQPAQRGRSGYRNYSKTDVHVLRFLSRARGLGFSVKECRDLLALYNDKQRASADVKRLAQDRIADVDERIAQLQRIRTTLMDLVEKCHGNHRPDCPILEELVQGY